MRVLVQECKLLLNAWRPSDRRSPLDAVLALLTENRRYESIAVYLVRDERVQLLSHAGRLPMSDSLTFGEGAVGSVAKNGITRLKDIGMTAPESKPELAVPIKLAGRVRGVLLVESRRLAPSDNVLIHEIAHMIARFLASNGKYLVRKARENAPAETPENLVKPYRATSDKNPVETNLRRAAAGETSRA